MGDMQGAVGAWKEFAGVGPCPRVIAPSWEVVGVRAVVAVRWAALSGWSRHGPILQARGSTFARVARA